MSTLKLPVAVDQLVATALAKDPATRFQDARAFHAALNEMAQMSVEVDIGVGATMVNIGTLLLHKPAPGFDDETLRTVEQELARALGPMARLLVHRAAAQTRDRAELCSMLSDNITDPESRRRFVEAFNGAAAACGPGRRPQASKGPASLSRPARPGSTPGQPFRPGHGSGAGAPPLEQAFVDRVAAQLAVYLGPIAQIV